jgi:methionine-gamma-lyase
MTKTSFNAQNNAVTVFARQMGPKAAFADGSWKNPYETGAIGKIRWHGMMKESIAAHAGTSRGENGNAYTVTPDYTGTTVPAQTCDALGARFANPIVEGRTGMIYSRLGHKPGFELECNLTGLHGCGDAMVFATGMAAVSHSIIPLVTAGDNIVVHRNIYGCSDNLFSMEFPAMGIESRFVDLTDPKVLKHAVDRKTRAIFFETPSNPALDIIDISAVVNGAKGRCPVIVDNTFASPFGQNPFEQGANIVVYSLTKSIGGHTNAIGGAVLGSGRYMDHLFMTRKDWGGAMVAREATAFLDGIKTLAIRYNSMEQNAQEVAQMLLGRREISKLIYPGLDPRYPFNWQMKGPGYMIAFILKTGIEGGKALIDNLKLITNAVSLGGVESLICHPASTTHACIQKEQREAKGISDGLVRLSVGVENVGDIIKDLEQAFDKVAKL